MYKNKLILSLIIFVFSYYTLLSQNTYDEALSAVNSAETLQSNGEYVKSYEKSLEAIDLLDKATFDVFREIMNINIANIKSSADKSVMELRSLGVANDNQFKGEFNNIISLLNSANTSNKAANENTTNFTYASNNYISALNSFNKASDDASNLKNNYLQRERNTTSTLITEAREKYNEALKNSAIKLNDNTDRGVKSAFNSANNALKNDNFNGAKANVNNALNLINKANQNFKNLISKAKTDLSNAENRYNDALNGKVIAKNDENDKNVLSIIGDASDALKDNEPALSSSKSSEAIIMLNDLISKNDEKKRENALKLGETKDKYNSLVERDIIIKDSEDDSKANNAINDAEIAYNENSQNIASEKITTAQNILNEIEANALVSTNTQTNNTETLPIDATGTLLVESIDTNTSGINTQGKITILPKEYTVVRRVPLTDALWRIANMSFIYNDPYQWRLIYNANRNILVDPDNPDLILPGQVLTIPSFRGEKREGLYDTNKEYITFDEALILENITTTNTTTN